MGLNIYEICKGMLPKLLSEEQEGKARYTFAVDSTAIAESILAYGCNAILITNGEELKEISELLSGTNMFANNVYTIPCLGEAANKELAGAVNHMRVIPHGAYRLYGKQKLYYEAHPTELDERLKLFIESIENRTEGGIVRHENGLIKASSKENSFKAIADYLIKKYDIVNLDDELCINEHDRVYRLFTPVVADGILINELYNSSAYYRKELFTYISHSAPSRRLTKGYIAFKDCVLAIGAVEPESYTEDMYFKSYIPHNYPTGSISSESMALVDRFFEDISCGDSEVAALMLDVVAYCLTDGNKWQKTFFFYGDGCNGKGVFFRLLEALMGSDNVAYRNWTDLSSSTGRLGIIDKSLVLCNDIDNIYMKEMQALKTLVACEPQTVKQLYRDEFTATFTGKIISSGNDIPRVNDSSNAWNRRIIIIPFKGDFRANPDPTLADKLTSEEAVQALIVNAVIRVDRVLKEGFSPCKAAERELREYNIENNPILQLLYENKVLLKGRLNAKRLDFIYSMLYLVFCRENGFKPVSKLSFAKRAKKAGLLSVNTGAERLYYLP